MEYDILDKTIFQPIYLGLQESLKSGTQITDEEKEFLTSYSKPFTNNSIQSLYLNAQAIIENNSQFEHIKHSLRLLIELGNPTSLFENFFKELEGNLFRLMNLDFSAISDLNDLALSNKNLLGYTAYALSSLAAKMQTMVSGAVLDTIVGIPPSAFIVITNHEYLVTYMNQQAADFFELNNWKIIRVDWAKFLGVDLSTISDVNHKMKHGEVHLNFRMVEINNNEEVPHYMFVIQLDELDSRNHLLSSFRHTQNLLSTSRYKFSAPSLLNVFQQIDSSINRAFTYFNEHPGELFQFDLQFFQVEKELILLKDALLKQDITVEYKCKVKNIIMVPHDLLLIITFYSLSMNANSNTLIWDIQRDQDDLMMIFYLKNDVPEHLSITPKFSAEGTKKINSILRNYSGSAQFADSQRCTVTLRNVVC